MVITPIYPQVFDEMGEGGDAAMDFQPFDDTDLAQAHSWPGCPQTHVPLKPNAPPTHC